jgi:hypothetical protein
MSEVPEVAGLERFCRSAENFLAYADLCAAAWLAGRLEKARGVVKVRMGLFAGCLKGRVNDLTEGAAKRRISNLLRWLREQVGEVAPTSVVRRALLEYIYRRLDA